MTAVIAVLPGPTMDHGTDSSSNGFEKAGVAAPLQPPVTSLCVTSRPVYAAITSAMTLGTPPEQDGFCPTAIPTHASRFSYTGVVGGGTVVVVGGGAVVVVEARGAVVVVGGGAGAVVVVGGGAVVVVGRGAVVVVGGGLLIVVVVTGRVVVVVAAAALVDRVVSRVS